MKKENLTNSEKREFWNQKASTYPAFVKDAPDTLEMLEFFRQNGADFSGDVVDVGCGSGRFGLQICFLAKSVLGVDISEEMLKKADASAKTLGIKNFTTCVSVWDEFAKKSVKSGVKFDTAVAGLTPALDTADAVVTTLGLLRSGGALCLVGWDSASHNSLYDHVYTLCGVKRKNLTSADALLDGLAAMGVVPVAMGSCEKERIYESTPEEAMSDFLLQLSRHTDVKTLDVTALEAFVKTHTKNGKFAYGYKRKNRLMMFVA